MLPNDYLNTNIQLPMLHHNLWSSPTVSSFHLKATGLYQKQLVRNFLERITVSVTDPKIDICPQLR